MASADSMGRISDFLSKAHLARFAGPSESDIAHFLYRHSTDAVFQLHDFTENAINTAVWTTNAGTGATAFATPGTLLANGVITGASGTNATASNRRANLYSTKLWSGNNNAGMEIRFKSSRVSDLIFEAGFVDALTTITTASPVVTDVDTPAFDGGAGDAAVVVMDTGQTLTTMALACLGSGAVNTGSKDAIGTLAPTAATYMRVRVQLSGNTAFAVVDRSDGQSVSRAAAINGATTLRPWFFIGGGSATTCAVDVDYIALWADRA